MPVGAAGRDASSTACSRPPTSRLADLRGELAEQIDAEQQRQPDRDRRPGGGRRRDWRRRSRRRSGALAPARSAPWSTGWTSSGSSCRSPAAMSRPGQLTLTAVAGCPPRAAGPGRPARGLRRAAGRPVAPPRRTRLPDRQHRPRGPAARCRRRAAVRDRRLQDELARRRRRAADARGTTGRRRCAVEMERAHYGLQALLYSVALHRYLRWRLPDYDAERHLAGVHYLFLRGMLGAATRRWSAARAAGRSRGTHRAPLVARAERCARWTEARA